MNFMSWGYLVSRFAYSKLTPEKNANIQPTCTSTSPSRTSLGTAQALGGSATVSTFAFQNKAAAYTSVLYLSTYVMAGYVFAKTPNVMAAAINT
jgi:hypothetical protein